MYVYMSKHIYTAQELCWTLLESSWNINGWPTRNMPTRDGLGMYIELGTRPRIDIYKSTSTPTQTSGCVRIYAFPIGSGNFRFICLESKKKPTTNGIKFMCFYIIILNSPSPAVSNCYQRSNTNGQVFFRWSAIQLCITTLYINGQTEGRKEI